MWLVPFVVPNITDAQQLTLRSLTMSSGVPSNSGVNNTYTFGFTTGSSATGTLQGMKFVACQTAVQTYGFASSASTTGCVAPTGLTFASAVWVSQTGILPTGSPVNFAVDGTGGGFCTPAANVLCAKRSSATTQTASLAITIKFSTITNPSLAGGNCSANGCSFYIGIYTYQTSYATPIDSGTVAGAVVQTLQVTAVVAEILQFCVGSTSVDDATTAVGNASSCSGTTVDLGTLNPTAINYPITNGTSPNNVNGAAILRTNAINGSSVSYDSIQDTDSGSGQHGDLKIQGINCVGGASPNPNACITSKASQGVFTAGTSDFGMTIGGTNCGTETAGGYYTCSYSGGSEHLVPQTGYIGWASNYCGEATCNAHNGFKWDDTGTSDTLAVAASNNVVADEALILQFAATPSITNTFGPYSVKVDFTALPTF